MEKILKKCRALDTISKVLSTRTGSNVPRETVKIRPVSISTSFVFPLAWVQIDRYEREKYAASLRGSLKQDWRFALTGVSLIRVLQERSGGGG